MKQRPILVGALVGTWLGVPLLALLYLGQQMAGLPLVAFDLFSLVTQLLPGQVITAVIEMMVSLLQALKVGRTDVLAKLIEVTLALLLMLGGLGALGAVYGAFAGRWSRSPATRGMLTGLVLWGFTLLVEIWAGWGSAEPWLGIAWTLALSLAWGAALGWAVETAVTPSETLLNPGRRAFLIQLGGGALGLTVLGLGLGRFLRSTARGELASAPLPGLSPTAGPPGEFQPVPGTRPELTAVKDFYRVDISLSPPVIDARNWVLQVSGLVDRPLSLSYADLTSMPASDLYATLECISNEVGGDLISTTRFTGVPLADVLAQAGLQAGAVDVKFTCADGYTESLPIESALNPDTRLCFAMDGQPLTVEHGFPVRLFTPNRFGMKNPKWIVKIEAVGHDYRGYWEQRGWSEDAWVQTTSVIDTTQQVEPGILTVGGIAYAGARGISKVEVRLDNGDWVESELKKPLSAFTWVLWRTRVSAAPGRHRLTVRATDGRGELQTAQVADSHPNGATGYHNRSVSVE